MNREWRILILSSLAICLPMFFLFFCVYKGVEYDKKIISVNRYEIRFVDQNNKEFSKTIDLKLFKEENND